MTKTLAAYTPPECLFPPYFNATEAGGEVVLTIRGPKTRDLNGAAIEGSTVSMSVPRDVYDGFFKSYPNGVGGMAGVWEAPHTPEELAEFIKAGADYLRSDTCMDEEEASLYAGGVISTCLAFGLPLLSNEHASYLVRRALNAERACM